MMRALAHTITTKNPGAVRPAAGAGTLVGPDDLQHSGGGLQAVV